MGFAELARFKTEWEAKRYRYLNPYFDEERLKIFEESNGEWTVNLE